MAAPGTFSLGFNTNVFPHVIAIGNIHNGTCEKLTILVRESVTYASCEQTLGVSLCQYFQKSFGTIQQFDTVDSVAQGC